MVNLNRSVGMGPFFVKHIKSLESVQSKTVRFIGNLKGWDVVSKREGNWVLTYYVRRKIKWLNMFHFILTQSTCALYDELNVFIDNCFKPNRQSSRSQLPGLPVAVQTNGRTSFNSFIARTAGDMRVGCCGVRAKFLMFVGEVESCMFFIMCFLLCWSFDISFCVYNHWGFPLLLIRAV